MKQAWKLAEEAADFVSDVTFADEKEIVLEVSYSSGCPTVDAFASQYLNMPHFTAGPTSSLGRFWTGQAEKVYWPYMIWDTKKRYIGRCFMHPEHPPKIDAKGVELVRRDNAKLVRDIYGSLQQKLSICWGLSPISAHAFTLCFFSFLGRTVGVCNYAA